MKQGATYILQTHSPIGTSLQWALAQQQIGQAIADIVWPTGSSDFTINPTRKGNGVLPIRKAFQANIATHGWLTEKQSVPLVGPVDAVLETEIGKFAVEWETGNISSSHRSLNRLTLGLMGNSIVGGILVLPTRSLYEYLTDRVGNSRELLPYFPIYQHIVLPPCVLIVIEVEHDATSASVPSITKGTDGRALR